MDLKGTQLKDTFGNLLTIGTSAGTPTTGILQNGDGGNVTALGIGISSPTNALAVSGSIGLSGSVLFDDNQGVKYGNANAQITGSTANGLMFFAGGTEKMRFDTSGNLAIGATSASAKLHITHDSGDSLLLTKSTTEPSLRFEGDTDKDFVLTISGETFSITKNDGTTDILTLDHDTSFVGIGEPSPDSNLEIANNDGSSYRFGFGSSSDVYLDADNVYFRSDSGNTNYALLQSGKLGLGTTSPSGQIHIKGTTNSLGAELFLQKNNNNNNDNIGAIHFGNNADTTLATILSGTSGNNTTSHLTFSTSDTGTLAEAMRIDKDGNVAIGTTSADYKLHIFDDTITSSKKTLLQFDSNNVDNGGGYNIDFRTSSNDTADRFIARIQGAREGAGATSQLSFFTDDGSTLTQRMLINASGNVAIGKNAPIEVSSDSRWLTMDTNASVTSKSGGIVFAIDGTSKAVQYVFGSNVLYDAKSGIGHQFTVNNGSEVMRMDTASRMLVGKTSSGLGVEGVEFNTTSHFTNFTRERNSAGGTIAQFNRTGSEDGSVITFYRSGSEVGSISVTSSATAFNTSSDYRLKENIISLSSALDTVSKIKPSTFNFIDTPNESVDGFIAHELAEVVPYAVSGEKDGIDEKGNPIYQGVDHSKLVPLLVGAIQELKSEIEQLKNK